MKEPFVLNKILAKLFFGLFLVLPLLVQGHSTSINNLDSFSEKSSSKRLHKEWDDKQEVDPPRGLDDFMKINDLDSGTDVGSAKKSHHQQVPRRYLRLFSQNNAVNRDEELQNRKFAVKGKVFDHSVLKVNNKRLKRNAGLNNSFSNNNVNSSASAFQSTVESTTPPSEDTETSNVTQTWDDTEDASSKEINSKKSSENKWLNLTAPLLRQLILSHLIQRFLKAQNLTSPMNSAVNTSNLTKPLKGFRDSPEMHIPAEQRQYGILVNPYKTPGSVLPHPEGHAPIVRVLRGKIVPLNQLPPELIPIILGNYDPVYTNHKDTKNRENLIDSAIYTLLQNEELLNFDNHKDQNHQGSNFASGKAGTRKSPSTNFVGSVKASEPLSNTPMRSEDYYPEWRPGPRCDRLTEEICLDDSDYPSSAIMSSIYKDKTKFDLMYAELKQPENQVDGLSRNQEESYNYDHYFGSVQQASENVAQDHTNPGGFVCPSEVHYARPHRAKNKNGEWKVVVNVGDYTQTLRMEKCLSPGTSCKYVVNHVDSACSQVYSYHRLLVFNKDQRLHIDVFKVPSACACHVKGPNLSQYESQDSYKRYEDFGGHIETLSSPDSAGESDSSSHQDNKSSFSNTLWAILGNGQHAGTSAQSPEFMEEVRKQLSWPQNLDKYPQYLKHVSPAQVLKQLLEEAEEDDLKVQQQALLRKFPPRMQYPYVIYRTRGGGYPIHPVPLVGPMRKQQYVFAPARLPMDPKQVYAIGSSQKSVFNPPGEIPGKKEDFNAPPTYLSSYPSLPPNFQVVRLQFAPSEKQPFPRHQLSSKTTDMEEVDDLMTSDITKDHDNPNQFHGYSVTDDQTEAEDSKINFSYHPILEYLSS